MEMGAELSSGRLMTMHNPLSEQLLRAHQADNRTLLVSPDGQSWSYARFVALSGQIANAMSEFGVRAGDRILMQVDKSAEALAVYAAALRMGAVLACFNVKLPNQEILQCAQELSPTLLVRASRLPALADKPDNVLTLDADHTGTLLERAERQDTAFSDARRDINDVAVISYTSGTTGRAKGCMLTHGNLLSNAIALAEAWHITERDILLHMMPLYHTHGLLISTNAMLVRGGAMVMLDQPDSSLVVRNLSKATVVMATPDHYSALLATEGFDRSAAASVRLFVSGGTPLSVATLAKFKERTGQSILERHGMTELGVSASNPYLGIRKSGTVGHALPGIAIRLCDVGTGEVVKDGSIGVIEVRGPNVFKGYWGEPGLTRAALHDGYLKTGDVGRFDPDGYLEVLGRLDDVVMCGGQFVDSRAIEEFMRQCAGVAECAVVSVPHREWGEVVLGIVVPKQGQSVSAAHIAALVVAGMEPQDWRLQVIIADSLPKTSTGKLQKRLLRENYRERFISPAGNIAYAAR
jgi:malonyl-CoA/methylmalonyl-CoA synthetase